jgi:hypothetical protein
MKHITKILMLSVCLFVLLGIEYAPDAPLGVRFISNAEAIIGVAPGGSVVRRRAIIGTTAVVASSTANAAAASAPPPPPPPPPPAAGPPPVGSVTTVLPAGCTTQVLNQVEYQRCGSVYYMPMMQGSNLVYVVSQP